MNGQTQRPDNSDDQTERTMALLTRRIAELSVRVEKTQIAEYVSLLNNPRRLFALNFVAGLARGFGSAVGFTVLAALLVMFLRQLVTINLPLIGDFIAELVELVQGQLTR